MKRHLAVAVAAALVIIPRPAAAQGTDVDWGPKLRVTPFVGISPSFKQTGEAVVLSGNNDLTQHDYDLQFASGFGLGVAVEYNVWDRFGILASGMWSSRGDGELVDFEDELVYEMDGTNLWLLKAAVAMRLREVDSDLQLRRLNATIYAGPAWVHDRPKKEVFTPPGAGDVPNHFALNMGAEAEMPFSNNKLAFVLGLEDYMIFWDDSDARGRIEGPIQQRIPGATVAVEPKRSHLWMLRMGLTFRL
jgi:hypothetical protein